ncbi:MAG: histidine phosphatase family protein [Chitinophagales bacterium]
MNLVKELFVVRHGETDYNKAGIVQGRGINSSLNDKGRKQAQALFEGYKDHAFDAIYASALVRTHQTVEPFEALGYEILKSPNLDEIDWGVHEGKRGMPELREEYRQINQEWNNGNYHARIEGGESPFEVQTRLRLFFDDLHQKGHDKVLICSHGRTSRILFCLLLGWEMSEMEGFIHQNTGVAKLVAAGEKYELAFYNNVEHLGDS